MAIIMYMPADAPGNIPTVIYIFTPNYKL